jgi:predicted MFS family arabinose efflux permease
MSGAGPRDGWMTETENNPYLTQNPLDDKTRLDTLSWYLLVTGLMCIGFAGLFLFLREVRYQDYVLNGVALGRYLLVAGAFFYVGGRVLSYYRRYQRKKAGGQG